MRVLVACEQSGVVRRMFRARGHHAVSCDLLPAADQSPFHYLGDVRDLLDGWEPVHFAAECDPNGDGWCQQAGCDPANCKCYGPTQDNVEYREIGGVLLARSTVTPHWDMLLAFPPCTYLSVSGMHRTVRGLRDPQLTEDALAFVQTLLDAPVKRIALENPVSVISTRIRKPTQIIQPHQFGHDASKTPCLWLKNLPPLHPTFEVAPRLVNGRARWGNQTDSGQNRLPPSERRAQERGETYLGIAMAMADQWGQ